MIFADFYPLLFFTFFSGGSFGLWVITLWIYLKAGKQALPSPNVIRLGGWISFSMLVIGTAISFLHLSSPLSGYKAVLNWKTSWLSREIIFALAFLVVLLATMIRYESFLRNAKPLGKYWLVLGILSLFLGLGMTFSSGMIYVTSIGIPLWDNPATSFMFTLHGLALGVAIAAGLLSLSKNDIYKSVLKALVGPAMVISLLLGLQYWLTFFAPGISSFDAPLFQTIVISILILGPIMIYGYWMTKEGAISPSHTIVALIMIVASTIWSRLWFFLYAIHL